jgi:hypothetical protein
MAGETEGGDRFEVGDITGSQGIAIGRNAQATVTGRNIAGGVRIDSAQLRSALEELHDAVAEARLRPEEKIDVQTATRRALERVGEDDVDADAVSSNLQKVGETLKQANVALEEGTSLWASVTKLAALLGPLVGGAGVVAAWFGVPLR